MQAPWQTSVPRQMVKLPSFGEYLGARGKYPGSPSPRCLTLVTIAEDGSDIYDFDVNGRCISYYPVSLMLFHNPGHCLLPLCQIASLVR